MPRNIGAVGTFGPPVSALPTTDLFDGRTCVFGGVGYIVEAGAWTLARASGGGGSGAGYNTAPLGSLMWWSGKTAPSAEYVLANGQTLTKASFPDGYAYAATEVAAGNADWSTTSTTFRVPDYRDRMLSAAGTKAITTKGGAETHKLEISELPAHDHPIPWVGTAAQASPWGKTIATIGTQHGSEPTFTAGGNAPHNNMPPYVALALYVKVAGVSASAEVITGPTGASGPPGDGSDVGDVKASAALRPPSTKWLRLRDGMTLSRTDYPELFAALTGEVVVSMLGSTMVTYPVGAEVWVGLPLEGPGLQPGTTIATIPNTSTLTLSKPVLSTGTGRVIRTLPYGAGDGSTTFGLPSAAGRTIVAAGAGSGLTPRQPGAQWGSETHQLTLQQMPRHTHGIIATYSATGLGDKVRMAQPNNTGNDYSPGGVISEAGGVDSHPNTQPSVALPLYIRATP